MACSKCPTIPCSCNNRKTANTSNTSKTVCSTSWNKKYKDMMGCPEKVNNGPQLLPIKTVCTEPEPLVCCSKTGCNCGKILIKWNDGDCDFKTELANDPNLDEAITILNETFVQIDEAFNDPGKLGLTAGEIAALGLYDANSTLVFHGPHGQDLAGHTNHTHQPGTAQGINNFECSILQNLFQQGLLNDPNFLYVDPADAPKLCHEQPVTTSYLGNNQFTVNIRATLKYNSSEVAVIGNVGQYRFECDEDGATKIPVVVWNHLTIRYTDQRII